MFSEITKRKDLHLINLGTLQISHDTLSETQHCFLRNIQRGADRWNYNQSCRKLYSERWHRSGLLHSQLAR